MKKHFWFFIFWHLWLSVKDIRFIKFWTVSKPSITKPTEWSSTKIIVMKA